MKRDVLISLRDPDDPMAAQEHRCFVETTGLDLARVHAAETPLDAALLASSRSLFFGGSGAYSVLDPHPWVRNMLEFLVRTVEARVPAWASCFGFQGLALALGGEVNNDDARTELGVFPIDLTDAGAADPVFGGLPRSFLAQLGHHDHVDGLPPGVTLLATGRGVRNQAFKVDGAPFWASQFHPELNKATTTERWNHYRTLYASPDEAAAVDRRMAEAPDTRESQAVLRRFAEGVARGEWI
ncbi:MAG: synthase [Pseudomonadota bacterium]|jgi:GMP synthase (glutamine-hydrolysing)